jgi:hypothetical protein
MFEPFHEVVSNVAKTVLKHEQETGRPVIGVMPAYFPIGVINYRLKNRMPIYRRIVARLPDRCWSLN